MRRPRLRHPIRSTLIGLAAFFFTLTLTSRWFAINLGATRQRAFYVAEGCLITSYAKPGFALTPRGPSIVWLREAARDWCWWPVKQTKFFSVGYAYYPLWMPGVAFAIPGAAMWVFRRRIKPGHCRFCRYDLRGLPRGEGGEVSCPECGRADRAKAV